MIDLYDEHITNLPIHLASDMVFTVGRKRITLPIYKNANVEIARLVKENKPGSTYFDDIYAEEYMKFSKNSPVYMIQEPTEIAYSPEQNKNTRNKKTQQQNTKIKDKVIKNMMNTYPFNLFNFKTRDECKSSSRSKEYYINKSDLVNIIKADPNLTKSFPKGYSKLPKGELCDVIFDKKW